MKPALRLVRLCLYALTIPLLAQGVAFSVESEQALSLKRAVRICLVDLEIALQDAFGTVDYLSGFELIGERGLFALQEQALAFLLVQLSN